MKHRKSKLIILLLGIGVTALAQNGVPATGGKASGSGGTASYSVGQVVYTTSAGSNGNVAQGIQQPILITTVTGLEEAKGINLSVSAYPNPSTDYLILKVSEFNISKLSYQLYDVQGKLIQNEEIIGNETRIVTSHFLPSMYFIKVYQGSSEIKTFKIIKN